jgi:hypothetical protein
LPGLEAHCRARGDVEPIAVGFLALELERVVRFEEVIVRADLNGSVSRIGDRKRDGLASFVQLEIASGDLDLAGDHGIGL